MRPRVRTTWTLVASTLALALLFIALLGLAPAEASAGATNRASVIVQFGDGDTVVEPVLFSDPAISGLEALEQTGLPVVTDPTGLVCKIGDTGCPADDCFCHCSDPSAACLFWSYNHFEEGTWDFSAIGAGEYQVTDGAVDGWTWGQPLPPVTPGLLAAEAALSWLEPLQQADGGFSNGAGATADVALALAAVNHDVSEWESDEEHSLLDFLAENGDEYAALGASEAGKLALGVAAANEDPRAFAGMDLVISMTAQYDPASGAFGTSNWDQAFAMLGWRASGEVVPMTATETLAARRNADGGWAVVPGGSSDVDSTALALQALVAAGEPLTATALMDGVAFLAMVQNPDAGFPYQATLDSNSNSTAFAIQGLIAAGANPLSEPYTVGSRTPITDLLELQLPEGGFAYLELATGADEFATRQVIPALVGRPFPYLSESVAERRALGWVASSQQPDGSFSGFNPGATIDAVLAIVAAGYDPQDYVSSLGNRPLDYLETEAAAYVEGSVAATGKLLTSVVAAGGDPHDFAGLNLVDLLLDSYNSVTGAFGDPTTTFDQAWAIIGLRAARVPVTAEAVSYLQDIQATGGGWGYVANASVADPDSTALALQALAAAGVPRATPTVDAAFAFLHGIQEPDGGFPDYDGMTSAATTGIVLQALAAYGEDPDSLTWSKFEGLTLHTPIDTLLSLQSPQGGFAGFSGPNDNYSTYQALQGIAGGALPLRQGSPLYLPIVAK